MKRQLGELVWIALWGMLVVSVQFPHIGKPVMTAFYYVQIVVGVRYILLADVPQVVRQGGAAIRDRSRCQVEGKRRGGGVVPGFSGDAGDLGDVREQRQRYDGGAQSLLG